MRTLLATLLLCLAGCGTPGTYRVRSYSEGVAVAVSTERLVTVLHPPHVGQKLRLLVRGHWREVEVTRVDAHGLVELRGVEPLGLEHGDSGSPVALLVGRRR